MPKRSAGLLLYRRNTCGVEVFLVHPGGPFWAKKDLGAWSIPKGEYTSEEEPFDAACREFREETGFTVAAEAERSIVALDTVRQPSGKQVTVWALEGDADPAGVHSNLCQVEWPPRSGRTIDVPEVDRGAWYHLPEAERRIFAGQKPFLARLAAKIGYSA
jgi:predicted NUDIX family NTP pyrophosphohydrolase